MKDIELDCFHAIEVAPDHVERLEVASSVDHEAPPREAGLIFNRDGRSAEALRRDMHQLQKGLQPSQDAEWIGAPRDGRRSP